MSFALVFGLTLGFRLLAARGSGTGTSLQALAPAQSLVAADVRPDEQPSQFGFLLLRNAGSAPITLSRAVLLSASGGVRLVGFVALFPAENDDLLAGQCGPFPPPNFATRALAGVRLEPGEDVSIVVAVQALAEGRLRLEGLRLAYDAAGKRLQQDFAWRVELRSDTTNPPCRFDPSPHQRGSGTGA